MTDLPNVSGPSPESDASVCEPVCAESTDTTPRSDPPNGELGASGRGPDGRFLPGPGNRGNWRHGGRSRYVAAGETPEQAGAMAMLREKQAQIEIDLGGRDNLSELAKDAVMDYLRLRLVGDYLAEDLIRHGSLTTKGRQRAALQAYLSVVDRMQRIAGTLGINRREKTVTISEYLASRAKDGRE